MNSDYVKGFSSFTINNVLPKITIAHSFPYFYVLSFLFKYLFIFVFRFMNINISAKVRSPRAARNVSGGL
jgi:hypothetical protein